MSLFHFPQLDRILTSLAALCAAACLLTFNTVRAADGPADSAAKESELLAVLKSDAPEADKALTCKQLAIYGSSESVPELAKLLANERLHSWARTALEAIPGPASDEALRTATETLKGRLLVGTINSIGVRRDAGAVAGLGKKLDDADADVASAAAAALGHIGDAAATKLLRAALPVASAKTRSAVAEGCILCAERRVAEGKAAEATEIYDEVRRAEVPKPRVLEATRGAILSRGDDGIPLLLEQLHSTDKQLFQIGLTTAREMPNRKVDEALAAELSKFKPDRAALVLTAMSERRDTVVLSAIAQAAEKGEKPVRLAAIEALGRIGNASCLTALLTTAAGEDAELAQAAQAALAALPDRSIDAEIATRLTTANGKSLAVLIELVGQRRVDAVAPLIKAADHADPVVRRSALAALGNTVSAKHLNVLVKAVMSPKATADAEVAQLALKTACVRMPDREACAEELAEAFERAPGTVKPTLLDILAAVGGTRALRAVGAAAKSSNPDLQDVSSRLLGEWATIDAAPVLLDLSKSAPGDKYQVRALRGYIRIARQFVMPEPDRTEMCRAALKAARQPAEKKLVIEILKRYPTSDNLTLAVELSQSPELKGEATQAIVAMAQKLGAKQANVVEALTKAGLTKVKLEIVKAEYGAGSMQKDVTQLLRKQAGDTQLIPLPAATYNESFGGDPAPGTVKQLKVAYRMDGKAGEATFDENALIMLAVPR